MEYEGICPICGYGLATCGHLRAVRARVDPPPVQPSRWCLLGMALCAWSGAATTLLVAWLMGWL